MVVEDWLFTAACPRVSPGIEATICGQYVMMFRTVTPTRLTISSQVRLLMVAHTSE